MYGISVFTVFDSSWLLPVVECCVFNVFWIASLLIGEIAKVAFEKFPIFEIESSGEFGINIFSGTEGLFISVKKSKL